jgi:general secretion pathway protein L
MASPDVLFVLLPDAPVEGDGSAHWWRLAANGIVGEGIDSAWLDLAGPGGPEVIALAPSAHVRIDFAGEDSAAANPRQAATIARVSAVDRSLGEQQTLHAASAELAGEEPAIVAAVASNAKMLEWVDWAERLGARIDHIVPAAMVLPLGDQWARAAVGSDRIVGRRGTVMPDEPGLTDALLDPGEEPALLDPETFPEALARIAAAPVPDLRTGRFARRRIVFGRSRLRELAYLLAAIILVTTLIAIVEIAQLNSSTEALDRQTLEIARAVGGPAVTLETAEAELVQRAGNAGGGQMSGTLAEVLARLQPEPAVSVITLGYSQGTMTLTLAAPSVDSINRVLLALQRDGYKVTAVPRQGSDGRSMADVTVRA